jgi:hypothetical protein
VTPRPPPGDIVFRPVEERDGPALASFRCSNGVVHEDEVETFVRHSALARALAGETLYRLIVVLERERLIAVAGHHPELLLAETIERTESSQRTFRGTPATRLHVLALSLEHQGRQLADGRRLSDLVMATLIAEACGDQESAVLTALVAKDNVRSLALCARHGLTSQIEFDRRHVRVSGRFARRR